MLSKIYADYEARYAEYDARRVRLERLIRAHNRSLRKLEKNCPMWVNDIFIPVCNAISKELGAPYEIYGPFGLGCETTAYFSADPGSFEKEFYGLTVVPTGELGKTRLLYYTGEKKGTYQKGSIGELNGFNNVTALLPDSLEEIMEIVRKHHHVPEKKEV